jgi:2-dehydro-3-deoxygluconokinase
MSFDVVTFGETMVRLTPPGFERIEQASHLEMHVGGSESNTAVGMARMGARTAWVSRVTLNPLGDYIVNSIRAHGVDTSHVVRTLHDRVGTYFMERGSAVRPSQVFYDRAGSAMSHIRADDLPTHIFQPGFGKVFHTTGITLGISESSARAALAAARLCQQAKWKISFDFNYRKRLWSCERARAECQPMLGMADYIFIPRRDACTVLGISESEPASMLRTLAKLYPQATIILTLGAEGAAAITSEGQVFLQSAFRTVEIERLGGGDAFSAGFLLALIEEQPVDQALRLGAAAAAIKYTIPGDLPLLNRQAVDDVLAVNPQSGISR